MTDDPPIPVIEMLRAAGIHDVEQTDITPITTGMLNAVFRIKTKPHDRLLRVRTFTHPEYGQEFAAERLAYPRLKLDRPTVPRLHYCELDRSRFGHPFALFEYIEGPTLDLFLADAKVSQEQKCSVIDDIASACCSIHECSAEGYGPITGAAYAPNEGRRFATELLEKEALRLDQSDKEFAELYRTWTSQRIAEAPDELLAATLVHGDLHGRNIIVPTGDIVLIDWEASRLRMAAYDFVQWRFLNFKEGSWMWQRLLDKYCALRGLQGVRSEFERLIDLFTVYWHIRMALFQRAYPFGESAYHGLAQEHFVTGRSIMHSS